MNFTKYLIVSTWCASMLVAQDGLYEHSQQSKDSEELDLIVLTVPALANEVIELSHSTIKKANKTLKFIELANSDANFRECIVLKHSINSNNEMSTRAKYYFDHGKLSDSNYKRVVSDTTKEIESLKKQIQDSCTEYKNEELI